MNGVSRVRFRPLSRARPKPQTPQTGQRFPTIPQRKPHPPTHTLGQGKRCAPPTLRATRLPTRHTHLRARWRFTTKSVSLNISKNCLSNSASASLAALRSTAWCTTTASATAAAKTTPRASQAPRRSRMVSHTGGDTGRSRACTRIVLDHAGSHTEGGDSAGRWSLGTVREEEGKEPRWEKCW